MSIQPSEHVYFITPIGGGPIKIGYTKSPQSRVYTLATWSPYPLEILATAPGGKNAERGLHNEFRAHRFHLEWFSPTPALLEVIAHVRATGCLPDRFIGYQGPGLQRGRPHSAEVRAKMSASQLERWAHA